VPQPKQDVDWEAMGFNLTKTDFMYVANTPKGSDFSRYSTPPFSAFSLYLLFIYFFVFDSVVCVGPASVPPLRSGEIRKYGPLELEPAATVFSYGQSLFEGLKGTPLRSTRPLPRVLFRQIMFRSCLDVGWPISVFPPTARLV
jgi:hypothetical protein